MFWRSTHLLAFALLLTACGSRDPGKDRFAGLREDILEFMEEENVPSVSVAVAQDGKIIWEEAFGWADREQQVRATPSTRYELASIAKVFTVTGLMIHHERGLLNIDSPVQRLLPGIPIRAFGADASGVTLRRIIHHTSGLPMYWGEPWRPDTLPPLPRTEILRRYAILAFPPGEREIYSNLGISMAIHILEQTSGKAYGDFLREEVFRPLGLAATAVLTASPDSSIYAQQYTPDGQRWTYPEGFYTTAHDLLLFGMFHLKDHLPGQLPILSDSTIDLMQTSIDPHSDFRLPWWVWEFEGFRALVFTGASGTIMALAPEADLAIVVLANRLQANTPKICRWIAGQMLDDFDGTRRRPTGVRLHRKTVPERLVSRDLRGVWRGSITAAGRDFPVEIRFNGGGPAMRSRIDGRSWSAWRESLPSLRGDYRGGVFSAYFPLQLPIDETRGHDHWLWVYAGREADTLRGYAVAHAADGPHYGLPYAVTLVRGMSGDVE